MTVLRRLKSSLALGVTWAVGWGIGGLAIGAASKLLPWLPSHLFFEIFDAPLPALAIPGFVGGVCFSFVIGVAGRRHSFGELSYLRFASWGAIGGLLLSTFPAVVELLGIGTANIPVSQMVAALVGPFTMFGALSATGSLALGAKLGKTGRCWMPNGVLQICREKNEARVKGGSARASFSTPEYLDKMSSGLIAITRSQAWLVTVSNGQIQQRLTDPRVWGRVVAPQPPATAGSGLPSHCLSGLRQGPALLQ